MILDFLISNKTVLFTLSALVIGFFLLNYKKNSNEDFDEDSNIEKVRKCEDKLKTKKKIRNEFDEHMKSNLPFPKGILLTFALIEN